MLNHADLLEMERVKAEWYVVRAEYSDNITGHTRPQYQLFEALPAKTEKECN
jgi:hypothetical protein